MLEMLTSAPENIRQNRTINTVTKLATRALEVNAVTNDAMLADESAAKDSDIFCSHHDRPHAPKSLPSMARGSAAQVPLLSTGPTQPEALWKFSEFMYAVSNRRDQPIMLYEHTIKRQTGRIRKVTASTSHLLM